MSRKITRKSGRIENTVMRVLDKCATGLSKDLGHNKLYMSSLLYGYFNDLKCNYRCKGGRKCGILLCKQHDTVTQVAPPPPPPPPLLKDVNIFEQSLMEYNVDQKRRELGLPTLGRIEIKK